MFIEEEIYKTIIEHVIIEAVDLMIINRQWELLLWLRNNSPLKGIYYIPWGRRYKNELIIDSLKRKWLEELWINLQTEKLSFLGIYDDFYDSSVFWDIQSHYSSITYIYKISKEEETLLKSDIQHQDLKFFAIDSPEICDAIRLRINDMQIKYKL